MSAPNTPVATSAPRRRNEETNASINGSTDRPRRGRAPRWAAALAGVGVQRELADHQDRRVLLLTRSLAVEDAKCPYFLGEPIDCRGLIIMGYASQDQQAGPVDCPDDLAIHLDARRGHALNHQAHGYGPVARSQPPVFHPGPPRSQLPRYASTSTSIRWAGSASRATSTMVATGRMLPKISW